MTIESFSRDGVRIGYRRAGGSSVRIVLVHGLLGDAGDWDEVVSALGSIGSIAIDLRGHGYSRATIAGISLDALADDVAALVRASADSPVVLVGQSMGGVVAFKAAVDHPRLFARLVLVESGIGAGGTAALDRVMVELSHFPKTITQRQYDEAVSEDISGIVRVSYDATSDGWSRRWDLRAMQAIMAGVFAEERRGEWRSLAVPVIMTIAQRSAIDPVEIAALRRDRPDVTVLTIENSGHDIHRDRPAVLARIIREAASE